MEKTITAVAIGFLSAQIYAAPATAIFGIVPVQDVNQPKIAGIESLLFTQDALQAPASFTWFQDSGKKYEAICCVEVSNVTPIDKKALAARYPKYPGFANTLDMIKGYKFIYRASLVPKRNKLASVYAAQIADGSAIPTFNPAAELNLDKDTVPKPFKDAASQLMLKSTSTESQQVYTFTVDGKKTVYSSSFTQAED